jgi:hypothetical protein
MNHNKVVEVTKAYILERNGNNSEKLEYYLSNWENRKPKNLNELFKNMLMHSQNRQGMPNSIGKIENLRKYLFEFDPKEVSKNYDSWQQIFTEIKSNYTPPGRMDINNNRSYWVIFCKSILSISNYLSRFGDYNDFENYVNQFVRSDNLDLRIALPLLLSEEIFGFRFALACDFIKENVSPEFVKPDIHIKDIFVGIGVCKANDSDFDVFRKVVQFSEIVNKKPYWIDKLFWLIGSKTFYPSKKYPIEEKVKTSKQELIQLINEEIA